MPHFVLTSVRNRRFTATVVVIVLTTALRAASGLGDDPTKFDALLDAAYLRHDVAFMESVLADDMRFTHGVEPGGRVCDKTAFLNAAKDYNGLQRNVDSVQVERHGDIIETLGHIHVKTPITGPRAEYHVYFVRLYRRAPSGWQFVSHRTVREIDGPLPSK
jgi:hypothetical protein